MGAATEIVQPFGVLEPHPPSQRQGTDALADIMKRTAINTSIKDFFKKMRKSYVNLNSHYLFNLSMHLLLLKDA